MVINAPALLHGLTLVPACRHVRGEEVHIKEVVSAQGAALLLHDAPGEVHHLSQASPGAGAEQVAQVGLVIRHIHKAGVCRLSHHWLEIWSWSWSWLWLFSWSCYTHVLGCFHAH